MCVCVYVRLRSFVRVTYVCVITYVTYVCVNTYVTCVCV
jgi:hypothetical protein